MYKNLYYINLFLHELVREIMNTALSLLTAPRKIMSGVHVELLGSISTKLPPRWSRLGEEINESYIQEKLRKEKFA